MKWLTLARFFEQLEATASRNAMTELLAVLLEQAKAEEIKEVCYLALGQMGPLFAVQEFQLADKMVVKAIARAEKIEPAEVWRQYKLAGDLGTVAQQLKNQETTPESGQARNKKPRQRAGRQELSIRDVYEGLMVIANEQGSGSQERKVEGLAVLLESITSLEAKYIVRIVLGRLRLGFSDKTILDALSVIESGSKEVRERIETYYQMYPDIGTIALKLKQGGLKVLVSIQVTAGVPVMPALCQRLKTAEEMIKKMGKVFVEAKFDGTRVQIHLCKLPITNNQSPNGWRVKTFSRSLEETTWMFPELASVAEKIKAKEIIIDAEAVGYDPKSGRLKPFQETITRKRKHDIAEIRGQVPLKFFGFDLLFLDGESWLKKPLWERREKLKSLVESNEVLEIDEAIVTENPDELRQYHAQQLKLGYEGAVVKQWDGVYEPGRRGFNWVKFKEVETATGKLSDTIDAVVMGFYRGKGKRTKFGIGAFLVGVAAPDDGNIKTVAKIGTGLSDEQWREMKRRLDEQVSAEKPGDYMVDKTLEPDVWTEPKVVVEIAADEITKSPVHSAGWALRFPRLVRFRDDKSRQNITSAAELRAIKQG